MILMDVWTPVQFGRQWPTITWNIIVWFYVKNWHFKGQSVTYVSARVGKLVAIEAFDGSAPLGFGEASERVLRRFSDVHDEPRPSRHVQLMSTSPVTISKIFSALNFLVNILKLPKRRAKRTIFVLTYKFSTFLFLDLTRANLLSFNPCNFLSKVKITRLHEAPKKLVHLFTSSNFKF